MIAAKRVEYFTKADKGLVRAVMYFDIFNYPITSEEALAFAPTVIHDFQKNAMDNLVNEGLIFRVGKFYSLQNNPLLAERRVNGNLLAEKKMKTAKRYARLISYFPFVRAVLLSGSISKGFMDAKSDIDYFIITETKRLWIVRSALAIFRRLFLFNSHKNLCTNYFIDTKNLTIPDQNIFTATELITLQPMYGQEVVHRFMQANKWVLSILPQGKFATVTAEDRNVFLKRVIERLLLSGAVDKLNQWLMKKSISYWKRRYGNATNAHDFEIAFRSQEGVSKSHPRFFQKRALHHFESRINQFENRFSIDLAV